jgi:hypothetical protein
MNLENQKLHAEGPQRRLFGQRTGHTNWRKPLWAARIGNHLQRRVLTNWQRQSEGESHDLCCIFDSFLRALNKRYSTKILSKSPQNLTSFAGNARRSKREREQWI